MALLNRFDADFLGTPWEASCRFFQGFYSVADQNTGFANSVLIIKNEPDARTLFLIVPLTQTRGRHAQRPCHLANQRIVSGGGGCRDEYHL